MQFTVITPHPPDGRFAKTAFLSQVGKVIPLRVNDVTVGDARVVSVIVDDRGANITYETDENFDIGFHWA